MMTLKNIQDSLRIDEAMINTSHAPQANVSLGNKVPVIINTSPDPGICKTTLQLFHFGWPTRGYKNQDSIINAPGKGIGHDRKFRKAIRTQRCLIPANGFIQWEDTASSQPFFIYQKNATQPFLMAGIWEVVQDKKTGLTQYHFAIITTKTNTFIQKSGQHLSPVIFTNADEKRWLSNDLSLSDITTMLRPFDPTGFEAYPITSAIKSNFSNDNTLLNPVGKSISNEPLYRFSKKLELHGMGETAARRRRRKEQKDLPKD